MRHGTRPKSVLTGASGTVDPQVSRDREGIFEPVIVDETAAAAGRGQRDRPVAVARGPATGQISAPFAQSYGASVSKETVSRITDEVIEEMTSWATRALNEVYAAISIVSRKRQVPPSGQR